MSIQKYLDEIKNATYGREVRGAIHDAIKQTYDDASEGGDANMEVKMARGTFPNLNSRLDNQDFQLAKIPQQIDNAVLSAKNDITNYLDNQLSQIGNMTPSEAFATLQDLESAYPNGAEGVYIVQSDGNWYFWNGSNWVVGGTYQAQPWDEFMTDQNEEWVI